MVVGAGYNVKTGQTEPRSIWPEVLFGVPASEFKYRFNWQAPFLVSPHDPKTIYMAANVVFRTRDEGMTWEKISDDLTLNLKDKKHVFPDSVHRNVRLPHHAAGQQLDQ